MHGYPKVNQYCLPDAHAQDTALAGSRLYITINNPPLDKLTKHIIITILQRFLIIANTFAQNPKSPNIALFVCWWC